ncbi:MAG: CpaF family protein [Gammaproteobacteria bacterium]|nr:CpaF family protein [Gammaproteobacteria bacterium]
MDSATVGTGPAASKERGFKNGNLRDKGAVLAQYLEQLKPKVLAVFENDNVSILPRPELAVRIGQIVSTETDEDSNSLNLLDRRNLVADLIRWLLHCSPKAPPKAAPVATPAPAAKAKATQIAPGTPTPSNGATKSTEPQISKTVETTKARIEPRVMDRLDVSAASRLPRDELSVQLRDIVNEVLAEEKIRLNAIEQQLVVDLLLDDMLGLGPLEPLLADDGITDILINGPAQIYVERGGKLELSNVTFRDNDHVLNIARRIVSVIGRRVDETVPLVDARLQDGSRVNIIIPPLAIDGPTISIRKFAKKSITLDVMMHQKNISEQMATVLKIAARSQLNILISGGTGSGKTTLLNALSQMIDERERIVTIEDAAELQLQQPHVVRLETRPANLEGTGEITMRDLVKNSLRMRPDRIILGEVRGSEAVDMLQAMNTGHDGSLGTVHANRPREALTRLENMVGMAGINLPAKAVRTQIAAALDMIIQISRMRDGMRRITHITEVIGMEGDIITTQDLFVYEFESEGLDGLLKGRFKSTGLRPHFAAKAAYFGLDRRLLECMS